MRKEPMCLWLRVNWSCKYTLSIFDLIVIGSTYLNVLLFCRKEVYFVSCVCLYIIRYEEKYRSAAPLLKIILNCVTTIQRHQPSNHNLIEAMLLYYFHKHKLTNIYIVLAWVAVYILLIMHCNKILYWCNELQIS